MELSHIYYYLKSIKFNKQYMVLKFVNNKFMFENEDLFNS